MTHWFQTKAIRESLHVKVQFVLMLAGAQGGKTFGGAVWLTQLISEKPDGTFLITAPTYKHLAQATLLKFDSVIPRGWVKFNKQECCYDTAWGGKIFCRSLENPDSIEGISADGIWADECGQDTLKAWENMQARVAQTKGPWFGTTTPYGMNWLKTHFYYNWKKGYPEYSVVHFRSIDSPYFPKDTWERAKRDMNPKTFDMKFGGMFTRLQGLIYEDFSMDTMTVDMPAVPRSWERIGGIDFGWSEGHPFAASVWASPGFLDDRKKIFKVGEHKRHNLHLESHYKAIRALEERTGPVLLWYADPSAAQEIAELRKLGLNIRPGNNAVDLGINHVITLLRNDRIRVVRKWCAYTLDEIETYRRDERGRIVKENDHLLDADRYSLFSHMGNPKLTVGFY